MTGRSTAGGGRPARVLVVEDAAPVRELVVGALASEGFVVEEAATGEEARRRLSAASPDVVVLDVGLPDTSGFELLREIVATTGLPVIMLTSRTDEIDRVLGLELGAEDYVVKPFYPRELTARVRRAAQRARPVTTGPLEFGELVVDVASCEVSVAGRVVDLTAREFALLAHLAASPRRTFSRDELLEQVWQSSPEWQKPKTVTEHVRRLRNKLEPDPDRPRRIKTVAGVGYRFDPVGMARTVLYVDDSPTNVALVEHVLARRPGVRLLAARGGGVGMELAKEHQPDLVLLDLHLPDVSGEVVLHRLRADPRTRNVPVVMLSADATPGQAERLLAAGAADYLTKPFDVAHLLRLVDGFAGPGAAAATGGTAPAVEVEGPLDPRVLDSLRVLDDDPPGNRLAQLLALYLEDTAARLAELRETLARGDVAATAQLAHNMKGTSATYGAARLARLCGELERVAEGGDLTASRPLLAGIEEEFERVRVALRGEFPGLTG